MKSFPQAVSTPSASWRDGGPLLPGQGQGCGMLTLRPHSSLQTGGSAPRHPPKRLGSAAQSTFLLQQGRQAGGHHLAQTGEAPGAGEQAGVLPL